MVCGVPVIAMFNVKNHEHGTTFFDWDSRELTNEFQLLVETQCNVISSIL